MSTGQSGTPFKTLLAMAEARRVELAGVLMEAYGGKVASGPFAGMQLARETSWGDGDLCSKVLGCYEQELHAAFEQAIARAPTRIVNIGCAEGYYAIGLLRRLPDARAVGFDTNTAAQAICTTAAATNNVGDRLTIWGECEVGALNAAIADAQDRTLVVCDCEGGEFDLIDPASSPALRRCDLIVECHDFIDPRITPSLRERFKETHDIENVFEGARDPNAFAALRPRFALDRWLAVDEGRPCTMNWLVFWAREPNRRA